MQNSNLKPADGFVARRFPEAQLYCRIDGEFRHLKVPPLVRATLVFASAFVLALVGYIFVSWLVQESQLTERQQLIEKLAQANAELSKKSEDDQRLFATSSREIEEKYQQLQAIAVRNGLIRESKDTPQRFDRAPGLPAAPASSSNSSLDNSSFDTMDNGEGEDGVVRALPGQPEADAAARLRTNELNYAEVENALRLTKLDISALLAKNMEAPRRTGPRWTFGRGGPLIYTPDANDPGKPELKLVAFGAESSRAAALRDLAKRLPIDPPMAEGWISSDFGPRRDPMTGRKAFHPGLDIGGPHLSIIYAAGPGTVSFAGTGGPYGRMVEVTHDFGLKTRYGHLSRIRVKAGDQVVKDQAVGIMGTSGRSTGPHLHYEVLHNDRPLDPSNLLEAGYHVQRQQTSTVGAR